jgi:hypothetical protein
VQFNPDSEDTITALSSLAYGHWVPDTASADPKSDDEADARTVDDSSFAAQAQASESSPSSGMSLPVPGVGSPAHFNFGNGESTTSSSGTLAHTGSSTESKYFARAWPEEWREVSEQWGERRCGPPAWVIQARAQQVDTQNLQDLTSSFAEVVTQKKQVEWSIDKLNREVTALRAQKLQLERNMVGIQARISQFSGNPIGQFIWGCS